ncbi:MAG: DNA-directed RNA polymerase subunit omega [Thermoanaerobaculia bacterium]|nr:DNA-directed RNA polymerase subunit omega [Thermoanaerobaculia bacterium]
MERIPERVDGTFRYILVAAKRAEQLMRGARAKVEIPHAKAARLAMREVTEELIDWDYGPMPVPEVAPTEGGEETAASEEPSV